MAYSSETRSPVLLLGKYHLVPKSLTKKSKQWPRAVNAVFMPCYRWIKFYFPLLQTLRLTFSLLKTEDKIVPQHRHTVIVIIIVVVVVDVIIESSTDEWLSIQTEILRNCIKLTVLFNFVAFPIKDHRWLSSIPSLGPKIIECMVLSSLSQD